VSRQPGHIIMGYAPASLSLILEGHVRAELHSPSGREVILGDPGPSELPGEFAALDDQPRSATLEATTPCVLARFPAAAFRAAVFAHPETAAWMSRQP
jgi:CRP-like cAMP-binding protein